MTTNYWLYDRTQDDLVQFHERLNGNLLDVDTLLSWGRCDYTIYCILPKDGRRKVTKRIALEAIRNGSEDHYVQAVNLS